MAQQPSSIVVLSNCALDREAYQALLERPFFADSVRIASSAELNAKAVWAAIREKPDAFIVDADHANGTAVEMVEMIMRLSDRTRVLVVGRVENGAELGIWANIRIDGFAAKEAGEAELKRALAAVLSGVRFVSPLAGGILTRGDASAAEKPRLSPREMELLPLLAKGMKLRDAAAKLSVSYKTADAHRTRLLKKLGVRDRVELTRYAIRERIIDA